jgi:hypothetical protein
VTIRTKVSGRTTVHAGPPAELAELALEYAAGQHGGPKALGTDLYHFEEVARRLLDGYIAESAGQVNFWRDRPDGEPFQGPRGLRPDPDPDWAVANPKHPLVSA